MSTTSQGTESAECPTCGRTFDSEHGMKTHHSMSHGEALDRVEFECDWCGEPDTEKTDRFEAADHHFCSEDCHASWMSENHVGEDSPTWNQVEFECDWCGQSGTKTPSEYNENGNNFCSTECFGKYSSEHYVGENSPRYSGGSSTVEFECDWCGETSSKHENAFERSENHFCSYECHGEWESKNYSGDGNPRWEGGKSTVEIECDWCGTSATKQRSDFDNSEFHFCTRDCRSQWRSKNIVGADHPSWVEDASDYYGENWRSVSAQVRERDNHTCQSCGCESKDRELDVHHIIPRRLFERWDRPDIKDANVSRNLISLCRSCHTAVEQESMESPIPGSHWRSE